MSTTTEIARIDTGQLTEIVKAAPDILKQNEVSRDKAYEYGQSLIQQSEAGMNDNLDRLMGQYQEKVRLTHKTMNERRKAFTQITDQVKKFFTGLENDLSPQVKDSIYTRIQEVRNAYATRKIEEQRRKEREAQEKLERQNEIINIKKRAQIALSEMFQSYLWEQKSRLVEIFEDLSLKNIDQGHEKINGFPGAFTTETFKEFNPKIGSFLLSPEEVQQEVDAAKSLNAYGEMRLEYATQIRDLKFELADKLPSKKQELEEIAKADAAEKERIKKEIAARKAAEEQKQKEEAARKLKEAEERANVEAMNESITQTVDTKADLFGGEKPKVAESLEIIIKNKAAYALIFQFWFDKEGKGLSASSLERYTVARMKKFCENYATKNGETISSPLIEYKEIFKAK